MKQASLVFPDQLFSDPLAEGIFLVEDRRFFSDFRYHKKKLLLHRASMKAYQREMAARAMVTYLDHQGGDELAAAIDLILDRGHDLARMWEHPDRELGQRVRAIAGKKGLRLEWTRSPMFILPQGPLERTKGGGFSQTSFYIRQRKALGVLVEDGRPVEGKWSFDTRNRRVPLSGMRPPSLPGLERDETFLEAERYVNDRFPHNPGDTGGMLFPHTREQAQTWLKDFLSKRLRSFGDYQDAMLVGERYLFHSLLSSSINIGLLTPGEVLEAVLAHARILEVPINSLEGYVRQVLGWREFVRAVYLEAGEEQRASNHFGLEEKVPHAFYDARTGVDPVDHVLIKVMEDAYAHHIERLMVLGNFMLLVGIHPREVYRWFMEMFIDSYDWVMVPNVFGMGQYADGGMMSTKPYISSSRYLLRMSDHPRGEWCDTFDALYWSFINDHRSTFERNPRMRMMVNRMERMGGRLDDLLERAKGYKEGLWRE